MKHPPQNSNSDFMGSLNVKRLDFYYALFKHLLEPSRHVVLLWARKPHRWPNGISGAKPGRTVPAPSAKPLQTPSLTHKAVLNCVREKGQVGVAFIKSERMNEGKSAVQRPGLSWMEHCDARRPRQWMFSIPFDPVVRLLIGEACSTGQREVSLSTDVHCSLCGGNGANRPRATVWMLREWFTVSYRSERAALQIFIYSFTILNHYEVKMKKR